MRMVTTAAIGAADDAATAGNEEALVARARAGDREAFGRLVEAHLGRVWTLVWRVLRHEQDTEDVVQEVFLAAWQAIPGFRGDARLSTWLQTIAVTRAINHRARGAERVRRASIPLDGLAGDGSQGRGEGGPGRSGTAPVEPADPHPSSSPLRALEAGELRRRLAICLDKLPAAWRAVLALRDGDRPYEEIAVALGLALGTVRSRLARARLALRDCVEGTS